MVRAALAVISGVCLRVEDEVWPSMIESMIIFGQGDDGYDGYVRCDVRYSMKGEDVQINICAQRGGNTFEKTSSADIRSN